MKRNTILLGLMMCCLLFLPTNTKAGSQECYVGALIVLGQSYEYCGNLRSACYQKCPNEVPVEAIDWCKKTICDSQYDECLDWADDEFEKHKAICDQIYGGGNNGGGDDECNDTSKNFTDVCPASCSSCSWKNSY